MEKMKILTANIALGLPNMNRVMPVIRGHLAFHGQTMAKLFLNPKSLKRAQALPSARRVRYFKRHVDLRETLALIEKAEADVVVLNEIIVQIHRDKLEPHLDRLGYSTRVWGESKHYPDTTITTLIASRLPGTPAHLDLSWGAHAGGGAGVAALRLTHSSVTIIGLHLGLADKFPWLYEAEIRGLAQFIEDERLAGRSTIAAGDWNASEQKVQSYPAFSALNLVDAAGNVPTCPTFLPWLKPLDHIFVPAGWKTNRAETVAFGSDHLALLVETE